MRETQLGAATPFHAHSALTIAGALCIFTVASSVIASTPPPRQAPPEGFKGTLAGVNLGTSWNDMVAWTRAQAWSVMDATLALSRPDVRALPTNVWIKAVVINFADLSFMGKRPETYAFYEADNCTARRVARTRLGGSACNWNLRIVEITDAGWFGDTPPQQMGFPENSSAKWVSATLKPADLVAQFRASNATPGATFTPNWSAFGDPKPDVKANAIKVTVYTSAACPQVSRGLIRLGSIARARNPASLLDGPFPPMPPAGVGPRSATLFLGARTNGPDLTADTTETQAGFVNQVNEEIKRVKASCSGRGERVVVP
jgi:hypothetical protein